MEGKRDANCYVAPEVFDVGETGTDLEDEQDEQDQDQDQDQLNIDGVKAVVSILQRIQTRGIMCLELDASRNVDLIPPADGTGEVAVTVSWAVRMASQTVLYTALGRLPIPSVRGDVSDIYDNVVSTISGICANRTIPVPYGITASRNPPNFDSFADNQLRVHDEFQTILLPEPRVVLSKYITDSGGTLQFSDGYVRLCPRAYPLDHYSTHSGCRIVHRYGGCAYFRVRRHQ